MNHAAQSSWTLDDATEPRLDIAAKFAKLKLTAQLAVNKKELATLGTEIADKLKRLRLIASSNEIRKRLGGGVTVEPSENASVTGLREVAAGKHDSDGLSAMFARIQDAVNALNDAGQLKAQAEMAANNAIDHWAELEEKTNG